MLASLASAIRTAFAETILKCSGARRQSELIALAWVLRNRAERLSDGADEEKILDPVAARNLGKALLADVGVERDGEANAANGNGHAGYDDDMMAFHQALACVSLVFDGLVPDPTHGASRVHPHDQAPCWARDFEATALIGPLLFLREETDGQERKDRSTTEA